MTVRQVLHLNSKAPKDVERLHKLVLSGYDFPADIDTRERGVRATIDSLFAMSATLRQATRTSGKIKRIEQVNRLLVQAQVPGDWSGSASVESVRDLGETDVSLEEGQHLILRGDIELAANRSTYITGTETRGGQQKPARAIQRTNTTVTPSQAPDFIAGKLEGAGFEADRVHVSDIVTSQRKGRRIALARFEATGEVADADALSQALITGIGRGKAFGAGLIRYAVA